MFSVHKIPSISQDHRDVFPTHAVMVYYITYVSHIVTFASVITMNTTLIHIIRVIHCIQHLAIIIFAQMQPYN